MPQLSPTWQQRRLTIGHDGIPILNIKAFCQKRPPLEPASRLRLAAPFLILCHPSDNFCSIHRFVDIMLQPTSD